MYVLSAGTLQTYSGFCSVAPERIAIPSASCNIDGVTLPI